MYRVLRSFITEKIVCRKFDCMELEVSSLAARGSLFGMEVLSDMQMRISCPCSIMRTPEDGEELGNGPVV